MKRTITLAILAITLSSGAFAADMKSSSYLSLTYGVTKTSSDSTLLDGISGSAMGATFGLMLSSWVSWEFKGRYSNFEAKTTSIDLSAFGAGVIDASVDPTTLFIGTGLRFMIVRYLNVHFGLGYSKVDLKTTITGSSGVPSDSSGLGFYYGAGAQLPLGRFGIGADYTVSVFSADVSASEIVGNISLYF